MPEQQGGIVPGTGLPPPPPPAHLLPGSATWQRRAAAGKEANRQCPECKAPVHADKKGEWRCLHCWAEGGTFTGERMYVTARRAT